MIILFLLPMIPQLQKAQTFVYRNTHKLRVFDFSSDFVFTCAENQINQYKQHSSIPISVPINFTPLYCEFVTDKFFIASKTSLYCYKFQLFKVADLNVFSVCFFTAGFFIIVNGEAKYIQVYKINSFIKDDFEKEEITNQIRLIKTIEFTIEGTANEHGLCTAYFVFDNIIFLGFENGSVVFLKTADIVEYESVLKCALYSVCKLQEPVISIIANEEFIYTLTISKLFKIPRKEEDTTQFIYTKKRGKSILFCKKYILVVEKNRLLFIDSNLVEVKSYLSLEEIMQCKVLSGSLYIGFVNGMIVEYDIEKLMMDIDCNR